MPNPRANFDPVARVYRWLEFFTFGPMLSQCRLHFLPRLGDARKVLVIGDGDGRFVEQFLRVNHGAIVEVIDSSAAMLRLLDRRVSGVEGASRRVTLTQCDALEIPSMALSITGQQEQSTATSMRSRFNHGHDKGYESGFDLVVTHFFLDCLSTAEIERLLSEILPLLSPNALWILSEFAVPPAGPGLFRLAPVIGRLLIAALYRAFGWLTGLRVRQLPDYSGPLTRAGFALVRRRRRAAGLLTSELWQNEAATLRAEPPAAAS